MTSQKKLYQDACGFFPGGVNSPVRDFRQVGMSHPLFIHEAQKNWVIDEQGRRYVDFVGSWGPMIHGHAYPSILQAIADTMKKGVSFGAPTVLENKLAALIQQAYPTMQLMRFTSSGTEATMTAVRLARGATKRALLVKFEGCYHGHHDSVLVEAGSGVLAGGLTHSQGLAPQETQTTIVLPFNDMMAIDRCFDLYGREIAAVIVEPIAGNMGCIAPEPGFLKFLREKTQIYGSILIFDEVMTGFRVSLGGATELYQIEPDLITLGKIVGGGLPLGVVGGSKAIMNFLAPLGPVYHAGTLSGNPCAVAAGIANIEPLFGKDFYKRLKEKTEIFVTALKSEITDAGLPISDHTFPGMFTCYPLVQAPKRLGCVQKMSSDWFSVFFQELLKEGIYWPPSRFEACFISDSHPKTELLMNAKSVAKAWKVSSKALIQERQFY